MTDLPHVSVVIPHFNQVEDLRKCLLALNLQTYPHDKISIIVGDNNTPPSEAFNKLQQDFAKVTFVTAHERGAGPARNAALAQALGDQAQADQTRGEIVAYTDSDCVPDPNWLAQGVKALQSVNSDMVGGSINVTTSPTPNSIECFEKAFAFRQKHYVTRKHFSVTANLLVTSQAAKAIGKFKNGVAEDVDYCHRGRALGFYLTFNDKPIVNHPARARWADLTKKWDRLISERWEGEQSRFQSRLIFRGYWVGVALATGVSCLPHLVTVMTTSRLANVKERVLAAICLVRIRVWRCAQMLRFLAVNKVGMSSQEGFSPQNEVRM